MKTDSLRKLVCIAILAGCGDDDAKASIDAGDACLFTCAADAGVGCRVSGESHDQVLASFQAMCSAGTEVFEVTCQDAVQGIVIGSGSGNTTVFFDSDGGALGIRTNDEAVDPGCDGHAYTPKRISCNGTISKTVCSDAPVGSVFP